MQKQATQAQKQELVHKGDRIPQASSRHAEANGSLDFIILANGGVPNILFLKKVPISTWALRRFPALLHLTFEEKDLSAPEIRKTSFQTMV